MSAGRAMAAARAQLLTLERDRQIRKDHGRDRFWKAGLLYVNRGDPALVVAARFGAGWTVNLANPAAWLVIAALIAAPAGLAAILAALGNAPG
jgi:uncharacterized membrane protein